MNKQKAFNEARKIFPQIKPSRAAGFTLTSDGESVVIAGWDQDVALVFHNKTDLYRLKGMCEIAIANRKTRAESRKKGRVNGRQKT